LDATPSAAVELVVDGFIEGGHRCRIERRAKVPQCAVGAYGDSREHVLLLRGPAGAKGLLEWAPSGNGARQGGYYGSAASQLPFLASAGLNLVTLHDLPADSDAAPLGCLISRGKGERVAWDLPKLGNGRKLDAQFNYDGSGALIWFEVTRGG